MFDPIYLLTLLPTWLVGMYLLRLYVRKRAEDEKVALAKVTARKQRK